MSPSGGMADTVNDDLSGPWLTKYELGIGAEDKTAKARSVRRNAYVRLNLQNRNGFVEAARDAGGAPRRPFLDIVEDCEKLPQRPPRITKLHR
jgi:hypothetical protein